MMKWKIWEGERNPNPDLAWRVRKDGWSESWTLDLVGKECTWRKNDIRVSRWKVASPISMMVRGKKKKKHWGQKNDGRVRGQFQEESATRGKHRKNLVLVFLPATRKKKSHRKTKGEKPWVFGCIQNGRKRPQHFLKNAKRSKNC